VEGKYWGIFYVLWTYCWADRFSYNHIFLTEIMELLQILINFSEDSHFSCFFVKCYLWSQLSLYLTKHHAMKTYWGVEVYLHAFLTSALDGGEWSASRPGHFTPKERAPGTHWIGSLVGPRASLDAMVRRKIPSPYQDSDPYPSSP
jgi:hypothetical protein